MSRDKRLFVLLCVSGLLATTLAKGQDLALPGPASLESPPPLDYEISAYELAPRFQRAEQAWTPAEARALLAERVAAEKRRRELNVNYYRIGHTLAFPLPLTYRPDEQTLPQGIEKISYPWLTWLAWELESRWRTLHAGWRQLKDAEAGQLLQRELAALAQWQSFVGEGKRVSLVTGHLAACLALALADPAGWDPDLRESALSAGRALLDRDVQPWFAQVWGDDTPLTPARLHNIPTIAMMRSAQLARVIDSPLRDRLESRARDALHAWWRYRSGPERHTEGTAYDGYLLDTMTEWLAGLPDRDELLAEGRSTFVGVAQEWMALSLPGRVDLLAPLGDVEAEMPFWINVLLRFTRWYQLDDGGWLVRRFCLDRMPAAALAMVAQEEPFWMWEHPAPDVGPSEHLASVTLRTGWESRDLLAAVGLPRCEMGHLHADGGHVVLGWERRFWITDPGYQQYRPGLEREYTLGPQAHNAPVINGTAQSRRATRLMVMEVDDQQRQHVALDLTGCYADLPADASVRRDVWLVPAASAVVVRDTFAGLQANVEVRTHWLGATHLAWAFPQGVARLSDGTRALWIVSAPQSIEPAGLIRHLGSRGPLTLEHVTTLPQGAGTQWCVFVCDTSMGWDAPQVTVDGEVLRVQCPQQPGRMWSIP